MKCLLFSTDFFRGTKLPPMADVEIVLTCFSRPTSFVKHKSCESGKSERSEYSLVYLASKRIIVPGVSLIVISSSFVIETVVVTSVVVVGVIVGALVLVRPIKSCGNACACVDSDMLCRGEL